MIRITTTDVGLTQVATIWVGETRAIEFYTRTRHAEYSKEIAEEQLASTLGKLVEANLNSSDLWQGEPGGDHVNDWYE